MEYLKRKTDREFPRGPARRSSPFRPESSYDLRLETGGETEPPYTNAIPQENNIERIVLAEQTAYKRFPFNTSPEWATLQQAASNGYLGEGWVNDRKINARIFAPPGKRHKVKLELTEEEQCEGRTLADLEALTGSQDLDCAITFLYVANRLVHEAGEYSGSWFRFDDIIPKLGWIVKNTIHRRECHRKIYDYLRFGAIASVEGDRGTYKVPGTREVVSTQISGPLWVFMDRERPIQRSLFPSTEIPLGVEIVLNPRWKEMMSDPLFAQYLGGAELLSEVPSEQISGAWARAVGLALAGFWGRHPHLDMLPTREELLTTYAPKGKSVYSVLNSDKSGRAIEYWRGCLQWLVDIGYISKTGEAAKSKDELERHPRYNWQQGWLKSAVQVDPSPNMLEYINLRACRIPPPRAPRLLTGTVTPRHKRRKRNALRSELVTLMNPT